MKKRNRFLLPALAMVFSLSMLLTGCGSSAPKTAENHSNVSSSNTKGDSGVGTNPVDTSGTTGSNTPVDSLPKDNSKIIRTAELELQTKNYAEANDSILKTVKDKGGYIESSKAYGDGGEGDRQTDYTIRLPQSYFDDFLAYLKNSGKLGKVVSCTTSSDNISSQYYDTQAHIDSLKVQEQRLLELVKKSGSLTDILAIENQLANVRYQIESLTTTVKSWDNQVDYSTVTIHVIEVAEITSKPASLWGKIGQTFSASLHSLGIVLKTLLLVIVAVVPYLVIIVPVLIIVYIITKKRKKK